MCVDLVQYGTHEISTLSSCLKRAANQCEDGGEEESIDTSNTIGGPSAKEAADQCAKVVDADDASLLRNVRDFSAGVLSNVDFSNIIRSGVDTTHDTLIVTLKED